jgi:hypothetical protein
VLRIRGGKCDKGGVQVDGAGAGRQIRVNPYKYRGLSLFSCFDELKAGKLNRLFCTGMELSVRALCALIVLLRFF